MVVRRPTSKVRTTRATTVHVRLGRRDDRSALADMRTALWPEGSRRSHLAELRKMLDGRAPGILPSAVWVAENEAGELLGFAEVSLRSTVDGCDPVRPAGYLEGWFVRSGHRRSGIGRALIAAAEAWSRSQGAREMGSDALIQNRRSLRAHVALGFSVVDRCVNFRKSL